MDLFFEVKHHKTHIFCDAKETSTVQELKWILEGILKIPPEEQKLQRLEETSTGKGTAGFQAGAVLDDSKTLAECGFSSITARAQAPAPIGLALKRDGVFEELRIDALSTPPPLPDVMRTQENAVAASSSLASEKE